MLKRPNSRTSRSYSRRSSR